MSFDSDIGATLDKYTQHHPDPEQIRENFRIGEFIILCTQRDLSREQISEIVSHHPLLKIKYDGDNHSNIDSTVGEEIANIVKLIRIPDDPSQSSNTRLQEIITHTDMLLNYKKILPGSFLDPHQKPKDIVDAVLQQSIGQIANSLDSQAESLIPISLPTSVEL